MPNGIQHSTGATPAGCLRKGNMLISNNTADTGTSFYTGINPPTGGYTIYLNKASGGPSIYCPANDTQLVSITNQIAGANYTTAAQCLAYFAGQSDKLCMNFNYEGIVTNGLVLNLDAGFDPSYPTAGTTWYDLSGNTNNGTLTNGPTFNSANSGSIVFDGTNDYTTLGSSVPTTLRIGDGDFTIDFWVYTNGTSTYAICGNLNDAIGDGSYWVILNSTYTGLHTVQFGRVGISSKFGTTTLPTNAWTNIILSRIGTTMTCYINGASYSTTATVNNFTGNFNVDYLLGISKFNSSFNAYPLNGRLAILRIYKGVGLTSTQVLQNYNTTKGRFGL